MSKERHQRRGTPRNLHRVASRPSTARDGSDGLSPDEVALLRGPNFGFLATLLPDGAPHVTAVWVDCRDGDVLITSEAQLRKVRNVRVDDRVALTVVDRDNAYRQLFVRGRVAEIAERGAAEHADALAQQYLGVARYPGSDRPSYSPVTLRIRVDRSWIR
jgi:PPOX class probable F420-dependent enzyme